MFSSSITCTLENELVDCAHPQVCYETFSANGSELVSSTCGCISNFGYTGEQCDIRTTATIIYLAWFACLLTFTCAVWWFAVIKVLPLLIKERRHINNFTLVGVISMFGISIHVAFVIISMKDAITSGVSIREDGIRVLPSYQALYVLLFIDVFLLISNIVLISGAWYQLAARSKRMGLVNREDNLVRNISLVCCLVMLIVSVVMFTNGKQNQLYYVWGVAAVTCLLGWVAGARKITKTLKDLTFAQDTFNSTLVEIRNTALRTGLAILLMLVGTVLQLGRAVAPSHEPIALPHAPKWIFGQVFTSVGQTLTYLCFLVYVARRLSPAVESQQQQHLAMAPRIEMLANIPANDV